MTGVKYEQHGADRRSNASKDAISCLPNRGEPTGEWRSQLDSQRTSVGLDVHARSVVAAAIDERTGEVMRRPTSDRVKTDARDALHLARLLRWTRSSQSGSRLKRPEFVGDS